MIRCAPGLARLERVLEADEPLLQVGASMLLFWIAILCGASLIAASLQLRELRAIAEERREGEARWRALDGG
jgi:hypothetical protein